MKEQTGSPVRKILLVRVGRGGDLIMATPAIRALLEAFPAAEFHLLTTPEGRRIMDGFDDRITRTLLYTRRFPRTLLMQRQLGREIRAEAYDRIYIFEAKPHYRRWLGKAAPEVFALEGRAGGRHNADWNLDLVASSLPQPIGRGWVNLPVTDEGLAAARSLLHENGVDPSTQLVGLHPTYSGTGLSHFRERRHRDHRMWPTESFAALARILTERSKAEGRALTLVVDALPNEVHHVQPIIEQSGGAITLLAAPPNFQRFKALLSLMDVLVTANTGPMHMAAAVNTPLVALFSHWRPNDCGPFMDPASYTVLQAEDIRPEARGLAGILPGPVADAVLAMLDRQPGD